MVDINQRVFVEEDSTNSCKNYPNQEYASYQECDNKFVRNMLHGLIPVWLTENFAEVTTEAIENENVKYGKLHWTLLKEFVFS